MVVCKDFNAHYALVLERTSRKTKAIVLANNWHKLRVIPNREFDSRYRAVSISPFQVAATWLESHIKMTETVKKELEMIIAMLKGKIVAKAAELEELGEVDANVTTISSVEDLAGIPMKGLVKLYNATLGKGLSVKEIPGCEGDLHVAASAVLKAMEAYELPVKAVKEPKAPKAPKDPNAVRKTLNKEATITIVSTTNPKRAGSTSAARFDLYTNGMTVAQAIEAGVTTGDIHWDSEKGFITLAEPEVAAAE